MSIQPDSSFTAHAEGISGGTQSKWKLSHVCLLIFALSFFTLAMLPEAHLSMQEIPSGGEAVRVARSLASRGAFADPFASMPTGVTAHVAPVYPYLYAAFIKTLGLGYASLLILWGVDIGFLALQLALLPWLSSRLGLGMLPGIAGAALGTISAHAPIDTEWECFFAGLFVMAACYLTWRTSAWGNLPRAILLGVLWGTLILTNPVMSLLLIAWPVLMIASRPREHRSTMRAGHIAMILAATLTIAPWVVRNYAQFGKFIFVRDNLGLELAAANNPCAGPTLTDNEKSGCHHKLHPNSNPIVAEDFVEMGEYAFNQARLRQALTWIDANRSAFLKLTLQRFRQFWFPTLDHSWEEIFVWPITPLAVMGLFLLWRRNSSFARLIAAAWILFPLIYYLVAAEPRYMYPIYWTLLLPAGCVVAEMIARLPIARFLPTLLRAPSCNAVTCV